jgi:hypothetical protein
MQRIYEACDKLLPRLPVVSLHEGTDVINRLQGMFLRSRDVGESGH